MSIFASAMPDAIASATRYVFLVYAPDYTDDECLSRRLAVRQQHLLNVKNPRHNVTLKLGGALVSKDTYDQEQKKMAGSTMIFEADSLDDVKSWIEEDLYYTSNVWDKERLVISPFIPGSPLP